MKRSPVPVIEVVTAPITCHTEGVLVAGPIIAFIVVAVLAGILRWAFDTDLARAQTRIFAGAKSPEDAAPATDPADTSSLPDYGLLRVAAVVGDADAARRMQDTLRDAGIRSTVAADPSGQVRVMVFEAELAIARRLVDG
jgi:hypothetical protein